MDNIDLSIFLNSLREGSAVLEAAAAIPTLELQREQIGRAHV